MDVSADTRFVTLLGDPVGHSLSPAIHNAAFRATGVDAVYVASRVRPGDVEDAVRGLRALGALGANVTIPHKEAVVSALDAVTERARAVGAVNTIVCETRNPDDTASGPARLRGDNTDVAGFLEPLDDLSSNGDPASTDELRDAPACVLGAGGAARAVVYGLLTRFTPERLTVVARRPEQAEALARDLADYDVNGGLAVTTFDDASPAVRQSRLVVNATPVGMHPEIGATPWPDADDFGPDHVVYDLVYTPEETRLLREAEDRGATTLGGLDMLVGQAAAAFTQWTGRDFPHDAARAALRPLLPDDGS